MYPLETKETNSVYNSVGTKFKRLQSHKFFFTWSCLNPRIKSDEVSLPSYDRKSLQVTNSIRILQLFATRICLFVFPLT